MGRRIGIRLANGAFFDLISDDAPDSRKLRLNSVRDGQTFFYVELFSSATGSMADAVFVLRIELDGLSAERNAKSPIDFSIKSDGRGRISVFLSDEESGKSASVAARLPHFREKADFGPEEGETKIVRQLSWREKLGGRYHAARKLRRKKSLLPRPAGILPMAVCIICMLVSIAALIFSMSRPQFERSSEAEGAVLSDEISEAAGEKNKIVIFSNGDLLPGEPKKSSKEESVERYKVLLGDNLQDIARSYCKNAWLGKNLARANGIKNPDFVAAGKWILIPDIQ